MESLRPESSLQFDRSDSRVSHQSATNRIKSTGSSLTDLEDNVASETETDINLGDNMMEQEAGATVFENIKQHGTDETLKARTRSTSEAAIHMPDDDGVEDEGKTKGTKKRGQKLKKTSEKRTAFDGRKVVFVTEFTQTDWKWKDKVEKSGSSAVLAASVDKSSRASSRSATLKSVLAKSDSKQSFGQTPSETESRQPARTLTDLTPFSFVPDDEFGLPVEEISSDSDSSDVESYHRPTYYKHHLPSIGPPQILRYIGESEVIDLTIEKTVQALENDERQLNSGVSAPDEQTIPEEMFTGLCEFCGTDVKPFPSLDQQLSQSPESLYCCEDYRDFVEFAMTTAARLEEDAMKMTQQINVKVHPHYGSSQERQEGKERAILRMREIALRRRQTGSSGMHTALNLYSEMHRESLRDDADDIANGTVTIQTGDSIRKSEKLGSEEGQAQTGRKGGEEEEEAVDGRRDSERVTLKGKGKGGGVKGGSVKGGSSSENKERQRGRGQSGVAGGGLSTHHFSIGGGQGAAASYSSFGPLNIEGARQMKTINYQLSSQRCLEEGWTLRAPSPMETDDLENEIFIPESLHPEMLVTGKVGNSILNFSVGSDYNGKLQDRPPIEKFYPDGNKFLTIFPDGTGTVFYPSGRISILISSITLGQNTYIVQDDCIESTILAVFEPHGCGCCYFANGKLRLLYDQIGGLELDYSGARKRTWSWKDHETHLHVPPIQPIVFGMNSFLGIRFMAQGNIALTLTGRTRSCRFNVGAKLKVVSPDNIQVKGIEENYLIISEHKVKVETILNKIVNLLKFPKSPKVDCILPPLSVSSRKQKVDKMKQTSVLPLTGQGSHSKASKQLRLPPLDSPVVSVN